MKALCLFLALVLLTAPCFAGPGEVEHLRAEYEHRRAQALRPVNEWYRAQLEALEKKIEQERQALAEAKKHATDARWQEDQPELKAALLGGGWIWRSELNEDGVEVSFGEDGRVHHQGLNGAWKITGPNEVSIFPDDTGKYILRFNSSLRSFAGDRLGITGERREAK